MKTFTSFVLIIASIVLLTNCGTEKNYDEGLITTELLAVGTYTREEGHVNGKAEGIYLYRFNTESGELSYLSTSPEIINPSYVAVHLNQKWVFAVSEKGGSEIGEVYSFLVNDSDYSITKISKTSSGGDYPCYVSIHPSGNFLLIANYGGTISSVPILEDGRLGEPVSVIQHEGSGPTDRQQTAHAHMIKTHPNGFVYAADLGSDKIFIYKFDEKTGELIQENMYTETQAGAGPRHFTFHANRDWVYVLNELNGTVAHFSMLDDGNAMHKETIGAVDESIKNPSSADIHIHPNGKFLYASHRGDADYISIFSINQLSGELTKIGKQVSLGKAPRNFVIHPSGKFLLAANQDSDSVAVFRINEKTGLLTESGIIKEIPTPVSLQFF